MSAATEEIVERVGDLPALPPVAARIVALASSDDTDASELRRAIEVDPVLASKLLGLVNSAFFGLAVEIATIERAVQIVGRSGVTRLATSAALVDAVETDDGDGLDVDAFWRHSIATAVAAHRVARASRRADPEEAFLAGLVHDLGRLVLARGANEEAKAAANEARAAGRHLFAVERERLGFDHADAGRTLVASWGLPDAIATAVGHHHRPSSTRPVDGLTAVVHLAEIVAAGAGIGDEGDGFVPPLDADAWDDLGLTLRDLGPLVEGLEADADALREAIRP